MSNALHTRSYQTERREAMLPTEKTPAKKKLKDYTILIYGNSKIGKSTMCAEIENGLFWATEPWLNALRVESEITYHFERQSRHLDSVARWLNTLGIRPPRALSKCLLVTQNNNLFLTLPLTCIRCP